MRKFFVIFALSIMLVATTVSATFRDAEVTNREKCNYECGGCEFSAEKPCTEKDLKCINECVARLDAEDEAVHREEQIKFIIACIAAFTFLVFVPVSLIIVRKIEKSQKRRGIR